MPILTPCDSQRILVSLFLIAHVDYRLCIGLSADHVMFMWLVVTPSSDVVFLVFEVWISGSVESGPGEGPGGQPRERLM